MKEWEVVAGQEKPRYRGWAIAQLVKCLQNQHEALSSVPRTLVKTPAIPVAGRQRQEDTWGVLVSQPS